VIRHRCISVCLAIVSAAIPLPAANRPHSGTESRNSLVWTNDDLEKLHDLSPISIVGRTNEDTLESGSLPQPYVKTQDPEWYAEQAARLRDELGQRNTQLGRYRQAIEDAESLKTMTAGVNLEEGNIGITPEAGIEILQHRVSETQSELDALEDLARRNDISPRNLRGQ
jgi:hypothetical protein